MILSSLIIIIYSAIVV